MTNEALINPIREKNEPYLPDSGILYINPPDIHRIATILKSRKASSHFLFNSNLFTVSGESGADYFIAGPSVGAPMAVMTLEKLIALGAKRVIMYGWCGALLKGLEIGTVLLPTWGIPGEGTSNYYPGTDKPASSENLRTHIATFLKRKETDFQSGPVWTTDAVYRETRGILGKMATMSIVGVDMEFTALARVAEFRNIEFAAIFLVSDELWQDRWAPGFRDRRFKAINKIVTTELLELAENLESIFYE